MLTLKTTFILMFAKTLILLYSTFIFLVFAYPVKKINDMNYLFDILTCNFCEIFLILSFNNTIIDMFGIFARILSCLLFLYIITNEFRLMLFFIKKKYSYYIGFIHLIPILVLSFWPTYISILAFVIYVRTKMV